ncbi:hypothetical protein OSTOST_12172 [Ostertagia ostertagi]
MARSVSRPRKSASKSPARVKKMMSSPKSEPKKKKSEKIKVKSRSRSASKGRKGKLMKSKSPKKSKSISRSRSRPRPIKKFSPLRRMSSPGKQEDAKKPAPAKTPSVKTPTTKTPVVRKSSTRSTAAPAPKTPSVDSSSTSASSVRPSRSVEKRTYTSTPFDYEMRQRFLRPESSSRSPVKITPKKSAPSACTGLYNRTCGTVYAAGRTVYGASRAAYRSVVSNRREILVTLALLGLVTLITYFILYSDPAKTRAFIHSIPGRVKAWYHRQGFVRK